MKVGEGQNRRRLSLSEGRAVKDAAMKEKNAKQKMLQDEGWVEIKIADRSQKLTYEMPHCDPAHVCASWTFSNSASISDIFFSVFSKEFTERWLADVKTNFPGAFRQKRGQTRRPTNILVYLSHLYQLLACRIILHGWQKTATRNEKHASFADKCFLEAHKFLGKDIDPTQLLSAQRYRKLNGYFQVLSFGCVFLSLFFVMI